MVIDKPNDIIIRYTVYGFLIGIFFPFASLLLHSLTGQISFTLQVFGYLHNLFPGEKKNIKIPGGDGKMHAAQILLSMAETTDEISYTAFISL
jgi:hypothetical protein